MAEIDPNVLAEAIVAAGRAGHPDRARGEPWRAIPALLAAPRTSRRCAGRGPRSSRSGRRSAGTLDREVERVSVALARGAGAELIADALPVRARSLTARWSFPAMPSHRRRRGGPRCGPARRSSCSRWSRPPSAAGWTDDYGDVCLAIRYAVPEGWRRFDAGRRRRRWPALVGPQRALILTRLERPETAGELAELLHGVPSIASHHLRALERAGLVTRVREGRSVTRAADRAGSDLVALYSERP